MTPFEFGALCALGVWFVLVCYSLDTAGEP